MPRYHRWPNFAVLELLKTDGILDGFRIHFSTGACAHFRRGPEGIVLENLMFGADGTLEFFSGNGANDQRRYIVDGKVVDFGDRNAVESF
jgi:hypothetical protein